MTFATEWRAAPACAGTRYRRSVVAARRRRSVGGRYCDIGNDLRQQRLRRLPIGVGIEIEDDAVAEDGGRKEAQIVDAEVQAPAHQRQHAPAFDERLRPARRASIAYVLVGDLVGIRS